MYKEKIVMYLFNYHENKQIFNTMRIYKKTTD